jgi:hypothetical protein
MSVPTPTYYEVRCEGCHRLVELVRDTALVADVITQLRAIHGETGTICVVTLPTMTLHLRQEPMQGCICRCSRAGHN